MTRVVLHIDRLVLRGVDLCDAAAFKAALQASLHERLSAAAGTTELTRQHDRAFLRAAPLAPREHSDAVSLGRAVAGVITTAAPPRSTGDER